MNLEELMQDEEFVANLAEAQDEAQISAILASKGIELPAEEIKIMIRDAKEAELGEDALDDVAGGLWIGMPTPIKPRHIPWSVWKRIWDRIRK